MEQFPQIWTERRKLKKPRKLIRIFIKLIQLPKTMNAYNGSQKKMHRYLYRESCLKNSASKNIHWLIKFSKKIKQEVNIEGKVVFLSLKIWMHCEMVVLISTFLPHFSAFSLGLKMAEAAKCMKFFYFWSQFVESKTPRNKSQLLRKQKWKQRLQKFHLKTWFYHRQHACIKH